MPRGLPQSRTLQQGLANAQIDSMRTFWPGFDSLSRPQPHLMLLLALPRLLQLYT